MNVDRRRILSLMAAAASGATAAEQEVGSPPDLPRETGPFDSDSGSLFPILDRLASRVEYTHSLLVPEARDLVFNALGYRPPPVAPRPEVLDRREYGQFVREKIVFSTTPDFRVPAYVHVPKNRKGRLPAIIDLHSHGGMFVFGKEKVIDFGVNHPAMIEYHKENYGGRPTATELVRRGYVVMTIDAFPFGERRLMLDEDAKSGWDRSRYSVAQVRALNAKCGQKESTVAKSLAFAGLTWPGIVAWDDMRTLDYLISRTEVDPERIGCCGVSMGGYRSLLLSGLDDRIRAGCVAGFMSSVRPMIRRHMDTHSFVHFIPHVHRSLDLPDIVALRAPRPLMVQQCRRDGLFPPAGMEEAVRKIAAVYKKAGAADAFVPRFYDVPHCFNVEMQEDAFAWFDRQLK